jgi:nucleotide-binding universal stress UspA family protein
MLFSKIVIAFDGSELSKKALGKAINLAQIESSVLEVVHVYQYPVFVIGEAVMPVPDTLEEQYSEHAQSVIKEARRLTTGVSNVKFIVEQGEPAKVILEYAQKTGCDLIVMGSRGLGGIREFILGSVSHNVVQHSKVPVLIVK